MRKLIIVPVVLLFLCGCSKDAAKGRLAIYQLSAYQFLVPQNPCQVLASSVVLEQNSFVDDRDILHYDSVGHKFTLSSNAAHKLEQLYARTPLALTVDGEVIFVFNHMPLNMNSICLETITLTILNTDMYVKLEHYPPNAPAGLPPSIIDNRNDKKILAVLGAQGKL